MKVIIISCENNKSWYRALVGKVFKVCDYNYKYYIVAEKVTKTERKFINKEDCEVIK